MNDYCYDDKFEMYPIAMAYVPWQHLTNIYENLEEAYETGTIFPELTKAEIKILQILWIWKQTSF